MPTESNDNSAIKEAILTLLNDSTLNDWELIKKEVDEELRHCTIKCITKDKLMKLIFDPEGYFQR